MKTIITTLILFIAFNFNLKAQEKSRHEKNGDEFFFKYSFDDAIDSYNKSSSLTSNGKRNLADAYHQLDKDVESEIEYSKLVSLPLVVVAEDYFNYAKILKANGKYNEAFACMDKFVSLKPSDLRGIDYLKHKNNLSNLMIDDNKYKVVSLPINTTAQDFGPSFYKNSIVFASTRAKPKMIKRTSNWNGLPYLDMYSSEIKNNELQTPKIFDKGLDGKLHDGPASFNKEGTYIAFTRNNYNDKSKDKVVELQIYFSSYVNGNWTKEIPFEFNNENYSVGQPCLSFDGNSMYFTSDMPGGFGGSDIYKTIKNDKGEWLKPENLGNTINTEGDETFPFYEEISKKLLFTSDGLFGLGGTDIFVASFLGSVFNNAQNLGTPINTRFDDFSAIVDGTTNKGYFSSNRNNDSGNDDIYSVEFLNWTLKNIKVIGIAKDENGNKISNTSITLYNEKEIVLDTLTTGFNADYSFKVYPNKQFKIMGKHKDYDNGYVEFSSSEKDTVIVADVILLKNKKTETEKEPVIKKVKKGDNIAKLIEFKDIFFDLDKSSIRDDAKPELDKIITFMNENPSVKIQLRAHTDCRESKAYNQALSNRRAKSTVDYIKKSIINPERISGKGYGKSQLLNSCYCDADVNSSCSEIEHQKNRRTEFIVIDK